MRSATLLQNNYIHTELEMQRMRTPECLVPTAVCFRLCSSEELFIRNALSALVSRASASVLALL